MDKLPGPYRYPPPEKTNRTELGCFYQQTSKQFNEKLEYWHVLNFFTNMLRILASLFIPEQQLYFMLLIKYFHSGSTTSPAD
jgi:hypothetical protein